LRVDKQLISRTFIDHIYTEDKSFKFLKKLKKYGFSISDNQVEHPGQSHCRFLLLGDNRYLEFIHIGKRDGKVFASGLSFGYKGKLKELYKKLYRQKNVTCEYGHTNISKRLR
jgi:hypothetical protein